MRVPFLRSLLALAQSRTKLKSAETIYHVSGGGIKLYDGEVSSGTLLLSSSDRCTPIEPRQLTSIFSLTGSVPLSGQSDFHRSIGLLESFVEYVSGESTTIPWKPSELELRALGSAVAAFMTTSPEFREEPHITWFGQYGCALMAFQNAINQVQLQLVGLDEWSFNVHSGPGRTYCSQPGNDASKYINIGVIKVEKYAKFLETAQKLLKEAGKRKGGERSANSNKANFRGRNRKKLNSRIISDHPAYETRDQGAENRKGGERSANSNKQAHFIESSSSYKLVNKTSTSVNNSGTSKDTRYDKSNSGR